MLSIRHCEAAKPPRQSRAAQNRSWIATGLTALAMTREREA